MVAEDWHAEIRRFGDVLALKCLYMCRLPTNEKLAVSASALSRVRSPATVFHFLSLPRTIEPVYISL